MSGIAEVLVNLGYPVSGSDLVSNDATRHLAELGATVHEGHLPAHVHDADVVVISSAVRADNPEIVEARRLGVPVIPRAEMLAELMRLKSAVLVAGAHGKTSTTAMIAEVLASAGMDPTVVIGGRLARQRSGAKLGKGELMVAEADESDGSFLKMKPTIAVVTNIDREHLDHYADLAAVQDAFVQFLSRVPFYGAAVVCLDDPNVRAILPQVDRKTLTYGLSSEADASAVEIEVRGFGSSYAMMWRGQRLGKIRLSVPGRHSIYNSLAAVAVGLELEVPFHTVASGLKRFRGPDRRFQHRGDAFGATVIDDYAHHPTEIMATLAAAREGFGSRTLAVFQPHRFSRTRALLEEFGRAFFLADHVIVTEVYSAGEEPIPGIDGRRVADALVRHGHPSVVHEPDLAKIPSRLVEVVRPGDLVLTLGAGNVWKVAEALVGWDVASGKGGSRRKP
jgi:UDP-N-acetylmuramate--alanine ligase